jgi:hypothetical protein
LRNRTTAPRRPAPTRPRLERPDGDVDDDARLGSRASTIPVSSAQVTSAIVPWPQAVE